MSTDVLMRIRGNLLKKEDILEWEYKQFDEFFTFMDIFYDTAVGKISVNKDSVAAAYQYEKSSPMFEELLDRIDRPLGDEWVAQQFYMRLLSMQRTVKMNVQKKPGLLSPITVKMHRDMIQYAWMNELFDEEGYPKKAINIPPPPAIIPEQKVVSLDVEMGPSARLAEAMEDVARIYAAIAESVTLEEIKKLNVKDRIAALQKLSYLHGTMKKFKVTPKLAKANTGAGSTKDELESALLDFGDEEE